MFKNVSLRKRTIQGHPTWRLLGPDGQPIDAFTAFAESLRKSPQNTRNSYCRHLAEFLDYQIEAICIVGQGRSLTQIELADTIEAYGEYLRLGTNAERSIAREVAQALQPSPNKPSSVTPKKAALRRFLRLSEAVRQELVEIAQRRGATAPPAATDPLFPALNEKRQLRPDELQQMQANSMFSGVIAGGPGLVRSVVLDEEADDAPYDEGRAFPYDKVLNLIDDMPTYRDKTFYSLLAASGCRTHEGLQTLLNEDIDVEQGEVRLVDPASRPNTSSYRVLSPEQRAKLAWKGRTSDLTLLIEPFASTFFESLQKYLELEYLAHGKHDFLLQYLTGAERGMPYFLSAPSSRLPLFHRICKRIGVELPPRTGPHSLRHMYGTYVLNYFPRANGDFGMPISIVQQLLGHSNVKHTLKYAKFDKDLRKIELEAASRVLYRNRTPATHLELKLQALIAQLEKVQTQLRIQAS